MAKQTVNNGDSGLSARNKINNNFTEVYGDVETLQSDLNTAESDIETLETSKQNALGYTAENQANKKTSLTDDSDTFYPSQKAVKTAVDAKQDSLGYTAENSANKKTSLSDNSDTFYPSQKAVKTAVDAKSDLVTRVQSITSSATITPDCDTYDMVKVTAQAEAFTIANPTGTPTEGQMMVIRIKDNGTARAITFDTLYRAMGITLPTTTVLSKTLYIAIVYNFTDTKWDVINSLQQACTNT